MYGASRGYVAASVSVLALAIVVLLSMIAARSVANPGGVTDEFDTRAELRKSLPK